MGTNYRDAVRRADALPLDPAIVVSCILDSDDAKPAEHLFRRAFEDSLRTLDARERALVAHVTGHVAESVTPIVLQDWGYQLVAQLVKPGIHGVDLMMLDPDGERLQVLEVKGTLRPAHWPVMSSRALLQMSADWLDKADNPGMAEWELTSADVYGMVVLVNFADRLLKVLFTDDFEVFRPGLESNGALLESHV